MKRISSKQLAEEYAKGIATSTIDLLASRDGFLEGWATRGKADTEILDEMAAVRKTDRTSTMRLGAIVALLIAKNELGKLDEQD